MPTARSWSASLLFAVFAVACGGSVAADKDGTGGASGSGGNAGSGGSAGCGGAGAVACGSCEYGGKVYQDGAAFPATDGCNTCNCSKGSVGCTLMLCTNGCDFNGAHYEPGESFPAGDGCNSCMCQSDGSIACTKAFCAPVCTYAGKDYQLGETFAAIDGCNKCTCTDQGVSCTEMACACDASKEWWRDYVGKSPQECMTIKYACPMNTTPFSNACGCGCEQDASCPQSIDCMPPAPNCDALQKKCPYSGVAY